jgi:hypothetical protein
MPRLAGGGGRRKPFFAAGLLLLCVQKAICVNDDDDSSRVDLHVGESALSVLQNARTRTRRARCITRTLIAPLLHPQTTPKNSLWNNIKAPSQLQPSATYYLFKDGIQPKWEDPKNAHGGCWTATAPRTPNAGQVLDSWWLNSVLACIGEQFDEGDEVCGVTVNIRQGKSRIEMWTKTAANEALQMSVGKQLKQALDMGENAKIGFSVFADKLQQGKARDRYSV